MKEDIKLKKSELKVLEYLIFEGKEPLSKMAKKLKMQTSTLEYIIKRLEENKVIIGYRYRFDCFKIGYENVNWVFLKTDYKKEEYKKLVVELSKKKNVATSAAITGGKDIALKVVSKDAKDFFDALNLIIKEKGETIKNVDAHICSWTYKLHNRKIEGKEIKMGKKYYDIIDYISKNPEAKIQDISKGLKKHRNTIAKIIREMKKEKAIIKKGVVVNPKYYEELGINLKAIVMIKIEGGNIQKVAEEISELKEVHELSDIITSNSLIAVVRVRGSEELFSLIRKINYDLRNSKYVVGTETYILLHSEVNSVASFH